MSRILGALMFCVMSIGGIAAAQSSYQELTPGTSTRQQVTAAFGQPVRAVSPTIEIYAGQAGIQQIEVEYTAAGVVDRLDVVLQQPVTRTALIGRFGLPAEPLSQKTSADGKLIELFGAPALVAFTYASSAVAGGVARIGHYSPALFAAAAGVPLQSVQPAGPPVNANAAGSGNGGARGCFAEDTGIQATDNSDSFGWMKRQDVGMLMPFVTVKIQLLFLCRALNQDQLASAYADLSTVRAWNRAPLADSCFGGDRGVLNASWEQHKAFAESRSRNELIDRMLSKVGAAFACLKKDRTWQNYLMGDISAAIARAAGF